MWCKFLAQNNHLDLKKFTFRVHVNYTLYFKHHIIGSASSLIKTRYNLGYLNANYNYINL